MTTRYKIVLFVRFIGYTLFFTGFLTFFFVLGPLVKAEVDYRVGQLLQVKKTVPTIITSDGQEATQGAEVTSFADIEQSGSNIIPVSTDYGIVIEKINANAAVVPGVDPGNERAYSRALTQGVAEAIGSTLPGQPGNLYLFSHSTDAPWNIIRFNAVFYLLRELETGDKVIIFYKNRRYDYIVYDKQVASPSDVSYLTNRYNVPVLTLQTCDPPGTLLNRLVIRAKLSGS